MAQARTVSVLAAAENALAAWIASQLPDVVTNDEWPDPGIALPRQGAVTILRAGRAIETPAHPISVMKVVTDFIQPNAMYFWRTHSVEQPLQIDVWSLSKFQRDDILNRLGDALTAGPGLTLSPAYFAANPAASLNQNPVRQTLLLQLAPPWDHLNASYQFDAPEITDSARSVKVREYRGTLSGSAYFDRTVARVSPRMTSARLALSQSRTPIPATPGPVTGTLTVAAAPTPANPCATKTTVTS
jgi:hypothetical protein